MEEIELTFLDIDKEVLEKQLVSLGAEKVGDYNYRRIIFDYSDFRLDKDASWVRLRDESDQITLSFKKRLGKNVRDSLTGDDGMYESETVVSDFDATHDILLNIGLIEKTYQENKRTRYMLDGVELDIDEWPLLKPFLEVEGKSWDEVYAIAEKLGLKKGDGKKISVNQVYRLNGLDDRNYTKLTFDEQIERKENRF